MMKRPYMMYLAGLLLFGSNGIVASHISLSSYQIVMLRTMIGSGLLLMLFLLLGQKFTFYNKKKAFIFLLISGISTGIAAMEYVKESASEALGWVNPDSDER